MIFLNGADKFVSAVGNKRDTIAPWYRATFNAIERRHDVKFVIERVDSRYHCSLIVGKNTLYSTPCYIGEIVVRLWHLVHKAGL